MKAFKEPSGRRIRLGIQDAVRKVVAGHECLDALSVGAVPRPHQCHTVAMTHHADAAQNESTHDDFADVRLARHEAPEIRSLDANDAGCLRGARRYQDLAVVEKVHLAGELPWRMNRDEVGLAANVGFEDFDRSGHDQKEVDAALSALEQHRPRRDVLLAAELPDPGCHLRVHAREGLRLAGVRIGGVQLSGSRGHLHAPDLSPAIGNVRAVSTSARQGRRSLMRSGFGNALQESHRLRECRGAETRDQREGGDRGGMTAAWIKVGFDLCAAR
jgi:hypothetical protein